MIENKTKSKTNSKRDQVCNSYLQSYANFAKSSGDLAAGLKATQAASKKGKTGAILEALKKSPGTKSSSSRMGAASRTSQIRPESPVKRGIGDMGMGISNKQL